VGGKVQNFSLCRKGDDGSSGIRTREDLEIGTSPYEILMSTIQATYVVRKYFWIDFLENAFDVLNKCSHRDPIFNLVIAVISFQIVYAFRENHRGGSKLSKHPVNHIRNANALSFKDNDKPLMKYVDDGVEMAYRTSCLIQKTGGRLSAKVQTVIECGGENDEYTKVQEIEKFHG
jgi:hypothetical protein